VTGGDGSVTRLETAFLRMVGTADEALGMLWPTAKAAAV